MENDYQLVTDLVDGRREIIGWARKGKTVKWNGLQVEEYLVLCQKAKTEGRAIVIDCGSKGWLPQDADEIVLHGAPPCDMATRNMFQWQDRVTLEILEAAERFRKKGPSKGKRKRL